MSKTDLVTLPVPADLRQRAGEAILDLVLRVPSSAEGQALHPSARAQAIGRKAARQASLMAGSMALPPGLLSWLTILPEMAAVWKLQSQMVSDIAAVYGKTASLRREQMLYCLFRHVSAQVFRDVVVRVGERLVIQGTSTAFIQSAARTLGVKVTQKVIGKSASRLVPLIGAVGVGTYAYFDTRHVARTAIELFSDEMDVEMAQE